MILTVGLTLFAAGAGFTLAARPRVVAPAVATQISHVDTGKSDMPVVRVFDDFECPACGRFARIVSPRLEGFEQQGRLRLIYSHAPIRSHTRSRFAAAAVACTDADGRSELRSLLHADGSWISSIDPAAAVARLAGKERDEAFLRCTASDSIAQLLGEEELLAARAGVRAVPAVWVDNAHVQFGTYTSLLRYIEERL